jgi:hypothetical protein
MLFGKKLVALLILTIVLVVPACSDDDDPVAPAPTMSGTWDVEWWYVKGFSDGGTWSLTENQGTIDGVMFIPNGSSTALDLTGTCSPDGVIYMTWPTPVGEGVIEGKVSRDRTSFTGQIAMPAMEVVDSLSATKQ